MKQADRILYESGDFWVGQAPFRGRNILYVWQNVGTHSRKVATIDLGERSLARAIEECERRKNLLKAR